MPNVPTAANNTAPNGGIHGASHQVVRGPAAFTHAPSFFNPVPVAQALKGGTTGAAYSEVISAKGGTSPYSFVVTSGSLPAGLSLASGGTISGTPTAAASSTFTVTVTDSSGFTGSQAFTIIIAVPASGGSFTWAM
jgi:large repetitive protein